eukprot:3950615-Prymnesium_polylepis.1
MGGGASKEVKLLDAARAGNYKVAKAQLKKKCDPNCRDKVRSPRLRSHGRTFGRMRHSLLRLGIASADGPDPNSVAACSSPQP